MTFLCMLIFLWFSVWFNWPSTAENQTFSLLLLYEPSFSLALHALATNLGITACPVWDYHATSTTCVVVYLHKRWTLCCLQPTKCPSDHWTSCISAYKQHLDCERLPKMDSKVFNLKYLYLHLSTSWSLQTILTLNIYSIHSCSKQTQSLITLFYTLVTDTGNLY